MFVVKLDIKGLEETVLHSFKIVDRGIEICLGDPKLSHHLTRQRPAEQFREFQNSDRSHKKVQESKRAGTKKSTPTKEIKETEKKVQTKEEEKDFEAMIKGIIGKSEKKKPNKLSSRQRKTQRKEATSTN